MRTREQDRDYRRAYRQRKREEAAAVATADTGPTSTEVQDAVRAELAPLAATVTRPALAATAKTLARILDDPKQAPHWPATARALGDVMAHLHSRGDHAGSKLAAMRALRSVTPTGDE